MIDESNQSRKATRCLSSALGLTKVIIREEKEIEMLNKIYCGDNLEFMHSLPDECIDLIYIDPPLFSNRNHKVVLGDEVLSFGVKWDDFQHYLTWMSERLKEMHRILKTTGSIFLHQEAYQLRFKMDKIFGENNFRNIIIWHPPTPKTFVPGIIVEFEEILFYTKSQEHTFNPQYEKKISPRYEKLKHLVDEDNLLKYKNVKTVSPKLIEPILKAQKLRLGRDLEDDDIIYDFGDFITNCWELPSVKRNSKENLNYPTQKPEALLERIIKASTNKGDIVFDPFCGCGTSLAVAKRLGMQFVGIDINPIACKISNERISCLK